MANIVCFILGHKFIPDLSEHGYPPESKFCSITLRCTRCRKEIEQETENEHDFDRSTKKKKYECHDYDWTSSHTHVCDEVVTIVCKTCGYSIITRETCFRYDYRSARNGCLEERKCPACKKSFDFVVRPHELVVLDEKFVPLEEGCGQEKGTCSKCGWQDRGYKIKHHDWGKMVKISTCVQTHTCQRCGFEQTINHHDWQKIGEVMNHRSVSYAGGDLYQYDQEYKCTICELSKIENHTYFPPFKVLNSSHL